MGRLEVYVCKSKLISTYSVAREKAMVVMEEILGVEREIDRLAYQLYGLTEEEIRIVEER